MSKIHTNPEHLRRSGTKLGNFGGKLADGGQKLESAGERLVSHASGDRSGLGSVISKALGKGVQITGKVFNEGGRVAEGAGKRLHTTADLHEQADEHGAGLLKKLHPDTKGKIDPKGSATHKKSPTTKSTSRKDRTVTRLPRGKDGERTRISGDLFDTKGKAAGRRGDITTDPHYPQKYRYSNGPTGALNGPDGPVQTRHLTHPDADLVDKQDLELAAFRKTQLAQGGSTGDSLFKAGLPADSDEVKKLLHGGDGYAGLGKDEWRTRYYHGKTPEGYDNYDWPDKTRYPDGFSSSEDRHPVVLERGTVIDRFGDPDGRYLSPAGTPFDDRAIPGDSLDKGYHRYEVVKEIPAWMGGIAPAMGFPGGGIQYLSPHSVEDLVLAGYLKEI
jgi:hypothetical protein